MHARRTQLQLRAFTLIELVVVIVILGVVAAAIAPRFVAGSSRAAEVSAGALRDLVSAVATRSALTGRRVAIGYDARTHTADALAWKSAAGPADWSARSQWTADPLTPPASLASVTVTSVRADGLTLDPAAWRIEFDPGSRRPALSITLAQVGGPRSWRIDLPTGAMRAELSSADARVPQSVGAVIDLDAAGRPEEAW